MESAYAAGIVKSGQQYQAFASASGVIQAVLVRGGNSVQAGAPLLAIASDVPRRAQENAALAARYADVAANQSLLQEARERIALQRRTMQNDQLQLTRQRQFWQQNIGNLDKKNGEIVFDIFKELAETYQQALLIVTHDSEFAAKTHRIIKMEDSRLVSPPATNPARPE